MKSWKAWLLVVVIFCSGAAVGAFGMRAYMARNLPELLAHTRKRLEEHFLETIDREVGLTDAQKQRVLPILIEAVQKGDAVRESIHDQMEKIRTEADDRIAAELDAQQRVKFAEFRARMDKMRPGGPPPGGMPPPGPPGFPPGPPPPGFGSPPPGPHPGGAGEPAPPAK